MSPPMDKSAIEMVTNGWGSLRHFWAQAVRRSDNSVDGRLTHKFIKRGCFLSRWLADVGKGKNAHRSDLVTPREGDFVAGFHSTRRLGNVAINGSSARITKTLCQSTSGTKATCFEEDVEAHKNGCQVSGVRCQVPCLLTPDTRHLISILGFRKNSQQLALFLLGRLRAAACLDVSVVGHFCRIQLQEWRNRLTVVF